MKNVCYARDCERECKPEKLMCPKHWRMVPSHIQKEVYKHYRHGQAEGKKPSEDWILAVNAAVKAVSAHENRPDPNQLDLFGAPLPQAEKKSGGLH